MGIRTGPGGREILFLLLMLQLGICLFWPDIQRKIQLFAGNAPVQMTAGEPGRYLQTPHFQIDYAGCSMKDAEMTALSAEKAFKALQEAGFAAKIPDKEKIFLKLYPDTESLSEDFGWKADTRAMGAYLKGRLGVLAPSAWLSDEENQEVFDREGPVLHELVHLMVDEMSAGHYNRWWTEGVAQYMEKKIYHFTMQPPAEAERFYTLWELEEKFGRLDETLAYWQSRMAVEYIVEKHTEAVLPVIMQQAAEKQNFQTALTAVLEMTDTEFESSYQEYITQKWGTGWRVEEQPNTH